MTPENRISIEGLTLNQLHSLRLGVIHDYDLQRRLLGQIKVVEGRLSPEEVFHAAQELHELFRKEVHHVKGFEKATAASFLSSKANDIRIYNNGANWSEPGYWDISFSKKETFYGGAGSMSNSESLTIRDSRGRGINVWRDWWERVPVERAYTNHGYVRFISDPTSLREGQSPIGEHNNTKYAVEHAREFLADFLSHRIDGETSTQ